ncbi:hypothetical protein KAH94_04210 [bacterium]|nr:hypothetical protein [bacterium]
MIGKIINNKKILEEFWSSNTPNQYKAFKNQKFLLDNEKNKIVCGILTVIDIPSKEIQVYYGMTEIVDGIENRQMILEMGNKLPINNFINFINQFKKEK